MERKWKFHFHDYYFVMIFDDVEEVKGDKETLTGWLNTDVRGNVCYLEDIDNVLKGKSDEEIQWGNAYNSCVRKDFTEIHFNFEEDTPSVKPCTVPTKLLREIVETWIDEYEKFRETKAKK